MNQNSTILKIAEETRLQIEREHGDSTGWCGEAAYELSSRLADARISHVIGKGAFIGGLLDYNHIWIFLTETDEILDVTADQFGLYPKVWFPADGDYYSTFELIEPEFQFPMSFREARSNALAEKEEENE